MNSYCYKIPMLYYSACFLRIINYIIIALLNRYEIINNNKELIHHCNNQN